MNSNGVVDDLTRELGETTQWPWDSELRVEKMNNVELEALSSSKQLVTSD